MNYNSHFELNCYGGRGSDPKFPHRESYISNFLESVGLKMGKEGERFVGGLFGDTFDSGVNRFLNWVSKVHDPLNSWRYTDWGLVHGFQSRIGTELFEIYSLSGMLPAAAYTAVARFGPDLLVNNSDLIFNDRYSRYRL